MNSCHFPQTFFFFNVAKVQNITGNYNFERIKEQLAVVVQKKRQTAEHGDRHGVFIYRMK